MRVNSNQKPDFTKVPNVEWYFEGSERGYASTGVQTSAHATPDIDR
jgi:hypothetical protein